MKIRHGLSMPNADEPCGTPDSAALLPRPVHYDCAGCRLAITDILRARVGPPAPKVKVEQSLLFDDVRPRKVWRRR